MYQHIGTLDFYQPDEKQTATAMNYQFAVKLFFQSDNCPHC